MIFSVDFCLVVDLTEEKVILIEDLPVSSKPSSDIKVVIPKRTSNYEEEFLEKSVIIRKDLKPLQVVSPEGPSFIVNGNEISWQKFKFRIRYLVTCK